MISMQATAVYDEYVSFEYTHHLMKQFGDIMPWPWWQCTEHHVFSMYRIDKCDKFSLFTAWIVLHVDKYNWTRYSNFPKNCSGLILSILFHWIEFAHADLVTLVNCSAEGNLLYHFDGHFAHAVLGVPCETTRHGCSLWWLYPQNPFSIHIFSLVINIEKTSLVKILGNFSCVSIYCH